MIRTVLLLATCVPLLAQGPAPSFQADLHWIAPTLTGHFDGIESGQRLALDLQDDLGLGKDKTKLGLGLEYQGPRFGLEFSMDGQDYRGSKQLVRTVTVAGQDYTAGTRVDSELKVDALSLNWTIRAFKFESGWVGVDLGGRSWAMDFTTKSAVHEASDNVTVPLPQAGLSGGFHTANDQLIVRGYYHFLSRQGASYRHVGVDARYFPLSWLGVRAYLNKESLDVPKGSIKEDLEMKLERNGVGFGVVARF
jgi:hypothetical protein